MPTTVLFGEYELTVDDKHRLLIPSDVRKALDPERDGDGFFLIVGDKRPWLYPIKGYEKLVSHVASEMMPGEDQLSMDRMLFGMTTKIEWDKQGRVQLSEKMVRRTELGKEITMVGARDHLELWNRAEWDKYSEELVQRRAEMTRRTKKLDLPDNTNVSG